MSDDRRFYEAPAGGRRSAPAALRNREPIAEVLAEWLPDKGLVLEVASGTGEHIVHFAQRFPALTWQPSDVHPDALGSITALVREAGVSNVRERLSIDASTPDWPIDSADAVININMVHISPWKAALGLLDEAARLLAPGAPLILYGPWLSEAIQTAMSNLAFDEDLKGRDPQWGLRKVEDFAADAHARGFLLAETRPMPANNLMLLFRKAASLGD